MESKISIGLVLEAIVIVGKLILKIMSFKNPFSDDNQEIEAERIKKFIAMGKKIIAKNKKDVLRDEKAFKKLLDWENKTRYTNYKEVLLDALDKDYSIGMYYKIDSMGVGNRFLKADVNEIKWKYIVTHEELSNLDKAIKLAKILIKF